MFTLSREIEADRVAGILEAVDKCLASHSATKEEFDGQIAYKISFFSPNIRNSMFAPFSEVVVKPGTTRSHLVLRPVSIGIPVAFGVVAFILFELAGPLHSWSIAVLLAGPIMLYSVWLANGLRRISRWWRRL
jgi:hypothetical protein